jgi:ABC-2 type transport system ATP-binding protein
MLTGYVPPSSGSVRLNGHDIVTDVLAARRHLGVVPEEANVYVDLTVWRTKCPRPSGPPRPERWG